MYLEFDWTFNVDPPRLGDVFTGVSGVRSYRTEDGLSIWAGRMHVNASFTRKNRKTLLAVALGLAIYGAFVASGRNIGDNPLEVAGWAVLARKYTA